MVREKFHQAGVSTLLKPRTKLRDESETAHAVAVYRCGIRRLVESGVLARAGHLRQYDYQAAPGSTKPRSWEMKLPVQLLRSDWSRTHRQRVKRPLFSEANKYC